MLVVEKIGVGNGSSFLKIKPNRIYSDFNCDRENQNYSFLLRIIL